MSQIRPGDVLDGRYVIGAMIARGGMSTVYRATDTRLDRPVAAKVMDPRFVDDASFRARFQREARAVAYLDDESLVNVYDQGVDEAGHVFLIMEFVDGGTLRELLDERGPMPPHAAAAVMSSVLRALGLAHQRKFVHRDIKPENVLINHRGQVKLADFGLVRAVADAKITSNSVIVGTVAYLSPEQVTGEAVLPQSDVYSAGVLLFELLTGLTPFEADTSLGIAMKRLNEDVPPPSEFIDGIPEQFDQLVARACARNPYDRFANAEEFADELAAVAAELRLPAFRVPIPQNSAVARTDSPTSFPSVAALPQQTRQTLQTQQSPLPPEVASADYDESEDFHVAEEQPQAWDTTPTPNRVPARMSTAPDTRRRSVGRQRTRRGLALWIVIALIATLGMGLGAWWLGSGRYGEVPKISGMSQPQAMAAISQAGFSPVVEERYDDTVVKTQVIGSEPAFGENAVKGDSVAVLISLGRPTVPAYPANRSAQTYSAALHDRTLREVVAEPVFSDTVAEGGVVRSDPTPGQTVKVGSEVKVYHSKGAAPVKVPKLTGISEKEATKRLTDLGLNVGNVEKRFSSSADAEDVLESSPKAGTNLAKGSTVNLVVNNAIVVPDVIGLDEEEATQRINEAGFTVDEVTESSKTSRGYGEVISTSPKEGTKVDPAGDGVKIVVSTKTEVPALFGKTVAEARRLVEDAHLNFEAPSDASDSDRIIYQSLRPKSSATAGDTVNVRTL